MKKQLTLVAALGLAGALLLTGCGSNNGGGGSTPSTGPDSTASTAPAGANIRVWLVGTDTPQTARDYLTTTFAAQNPGSTITIEQQSWTGLVDKYTTALSGSDAPDVVEIGNTQAPTFTSSGAFLDLTDQFQALGGSDLLPGFVQVGSYNGKFYAAPYYSGARVVMYSTDVFKGDVPTTWDAYIQAAKDATTSTISGLYMPGKDWHDFITFIWANGGEIATQNADGTWSSQLSSANSIKGLQQFQDMFKTANHAASDIDETDLVTPFCAGTVNFLQGPSWVSGSISAAPDAATPGCSTTLGDPTKMQQFAIPGATAGTFAPVLAGGSNIAIPAKSQHPDLALAAMKIMLSDGYQQILAQNGMVPAKVSQAKFLPAGQASQAAANAAASAKLTPASPNWSNVESQNILSDGFSQIAGGADVATVAASMDQQINAILNAS